MEDDETAQFSRPAQVDETVLNMMPFDPQVKITGIHNDYLQTGTRNSSLIESTLCKSYLLDNSVQNPPTEESLDKEMIVGFIGSDKEDSLMKDDLKSE